MGDAVDHFDARAWRNEGEEARPGSWTNADLIRHLLEEHDTDSAPGLTTVQLLRAHEALHDGSEAAPPADDMDDALAALTDALVACWEACHRRPYRFDRNEGAVGEEPDWVNAGANLPELLSAALGMAAKRIREAHPDVEPPTSIGAPIPAYEPDAILVLHRPGSWEAQHVAALTMPSDSL